VIIRYYHVLPQDFDFWFRPSLLTEVDIESWEDYVAAQKRPDFNRDACYYKSEGWRRQDERVRQHFMKKTYQLINRVPVEFDLDCFWPSREECRVAFTKVGPYTVSTVFLVLDHNFGDSNEPILFETMVFGGEEDYEPCERCSTWDEAVEQHNRMLKECVQRLAASIVSMPYDEVAQPILFKESIPALPSAAGPVDIVPES
jgi:hypothetical protein